LIYTIAVHCEENARSDNFSHRWEIALKKHNVNVVRLNFKSTNIINEIKKNKCDGAMWHWYHTPNDKQVAPKVLTAIESLLKIPVFPNHETRWHFDEKAAQHFLFDAIDAPKVKSWVFYEIDEAKLFLKTAKYPLVFKLSVGAGSANVFKVNTQNEAEKTVNEMFYKGIFPYTQNEFSTIGFLAKLRNIASKVKYFFDEHYPLPSYYTPQKNYVYFQKFIENNNHDIRITVIGKKAFGYIRYNRDGDFRASGSGNNNYDITLIPEKAVELALSISAKQNFQSMAYDFLIDESGALVINEISYCYVNKYIHNCKGYWDIDLKWHPGNFWPEDVQVEYFLNNIKNNL
jgi:glutathione synthase/RimK-type ligase-like ATP-grasp enzyme